MVHRRTGVMGPAGLWTARWTPVGRRLQGATAAGGVLDDTEPRRRRGEAPPVRDGRRAVRAFSLHALSVLFGPRADVVVAVGVFAEEVVHLSLRPDVLLEPFV